MNQRHLLRRQCLANCDGRALRLACILCVVLFQTAVAQVVLPYSTTFPDSSGWTTSNQGTPASWSVVGGGYEAVTGQSTFFSFTANNSSVAVSGLGAALPTNSFVVSTHFTITSGTNDWLFVGLGALGNTSSFFGAGSSYQARIRNNGAIQIFAMSGFGATTLATGAFSTLSIGTSYELQLTGNYDSSGNLTLAFSVVDSAHSLTATTVTANIASASVFTGNNFGLTSEITNSSNNPAATFTTVFSDYSVALVPEPGTYALVLIGTGLIVWAMHRRKPSLC